MLRQLGMASAADLLTTVSHSADLAAAIAQSADALGKIFPETSAQWSKLQTARAGSVGWEPKVANPVQYLSGVVTSQGQALKVTTPGGREYALVQSTRIASYLPTRGPWMHGLIADGPISVQGTLGADGKTFNVEGFALNTNGKYDQFTFGRVQVSPENGGDPATATIVIQTARGPVNVTHPELRKLLVQVPRLAAAFPGEAKLVGDKLVYDQNPDEYFALSRFTGLELPGNPAAAVKADGHGRFYAEADLAFSFFRNKPLVLPAGGHGPGVEDAATRVNHVQRLWVRGHFELKGGVPERFVSDYISSVTDSFIAFPMGGGEADPVQAAVTLAEAGLPAPTEGRSSLGWLFETPPATA